MSLRLQNRKAYFKSMFWTTGWIFKNYGDSFAKDAAEGVSFDLGRRISFGWPRIDRGGERELDGRSWGRTRWRHDWSWLALANRDF